MKTTLPSDLDPDRYASRANRSTDEAITTALTHLNQKWTYVRMLFIAFNAIMPDVLVCFSVKLINLGLSSAICMWIKDCLSNHPQKLLSLLWLRKLSRDSTSSEPSRKQSVCRFAKGLLALHYGQLPHLQNDCLVPKLPRLRHLKKIIGLWTTSSQHAVSERPAPSLKMTCTPPITASLCCHLGGATGPYSLHTHAKKPFFIFIFHHRTDTLHLPGLDYPLKIKSLRLGSKNVIRTSLVGSRVAFHSK